MGKTQQTFAKSTYQRFKKVGITSYLVDEGISIISSIVIAQCVSSVALAAVRVVNPLYSIVLFLTVVIADATSNEVQLELGKFDKEKASSILMTGFVVALITGILILAFFVFGKGLYFDFMKVSDSTRKYAEEYLLFFQFSYALYPFNVTLDYFIADSANVKLIFAKRGVTLVCNTILAFILTKWLGITGIGLAQLIGNIINIGLMNTHFASEYAAVKPKWMRMEVEYIKALKGALAGGTKQLTVAFSGIVVNKIIIDRFGAEADQLLSIFGIVESVLVFECIYEALAQTARSQLDIYSVEGNYKTARVLIREALRDSGIAAIVITLIYELGAPVVPMIYNITDPALAGACVTAVRWAAILTVFFALYTNFICIHQGLQHFVTVSLAIVLEQFAAYCACMFLCTNLMGSYGIWVAYGIYPAVSVLIIMPVTWIYTKVRKDRSFPWLFDLNRPQPTVYNIVVSEQSVMEVRDAIAAEMTAAGVDTRTKYQMALVVEEFGMLVVDKNKSKDEDAKASAMAPSGPYDQKYNKDKALGFVLAEWDVWIGDDSVTAIVRDNGKVLDFSNEDNSTGSLGAYFLSCLMPNIGQVNYATAVSMNRHRFQVDRTLNS